MHDCSVAIAEGKKIITTPGICVVHAYSSIIKCYIYHI